MINLFNENIEFKLEKPILTKKWLKSVAKKEGYELSELNYIFCDDSFLHQINMEYLNHDTLTDIITFDNSEDEYVIDGEIYISIEQVRENAEIFKTTFLHELRRVMVHGVLHLCGYLDKTKEDEILMRSKENTYLSLFN